MAARSTPRNCPQRQRRHLYPHRTGYSGPTFLRRTACHCSHLPTILLRESPDYLLGLFSFVFHPENCCFICRQVSLFIVNQHPDDIQLPIVISICEFRRSWQPLGHYRLHHGEMFSKAYSEAARAGTYFVSILVLLDVVLEVVFSGRRLTANEIHPKTNLIIVTINMSKNVYFSGSPIFSGMLKISFSLGCPSFSQMIK